MGDNKVIDAKDKFAPDIIEFSDSFINNDEFLKLSCFNALEKAGYIVNPDGIKAFQDDSNLEVTGKIDIETLTLLIQVFDNDKIQDILGHFDRVQSKYENKIEDNKRKKSKKAIIMIIIWLLIFGFFEIYGFISAMQDFFGWLNWWK